MPKYVAFLRAINVGGHTVKMDHLRSLFEGMGFANVETFIASGNVIFDSRSRNTTALERKIEKHLRDALGYEVATFVRATSEVAAVANSKPFSAADLDGTGTMLYIGFLANTPDDQVKQKLLSFCGEIDEFRLEGREVYWLCRKKFRESEFSGALLERTLGMRATLRNSNTVKKIAEKYS